jgi:hypothetical protein
LQSVKIILLASPVLESSEELKAILFYLIFSKAKFGGLGSGFTIAIVSLIENPCCALKQQRWTAAKRQMSN